MPRINLLPWREQQRTERKKSFAVGMMAGLLAALAVTGAAYWFVNSLIDGQNARNNRLTKEIQVLDKDIQQINDLDTKKQQFIARMQIIEKLQRSRPEIVHVFDTLVKTVPGWHLPDLRRAERPEVQDSGRDAIFHARFLLHARAGWFAMVQAVVPRSRAGRNSWESRWIRCRCPR